MVMTEANANASSNLSGADGSEVLANAVTPPLPTGSSTPVTDNRGEFTVNDEEGNDPLPESAHQPVLENVDSRDKNRRRNVATSGEGPQSMDRKETIQAPSMQKPRVPRGHRRTHSEEFGIPPQSPHSINPPTFPTYSPQPPPPSVGGGGVGGGGAPPMPQSSSRSNRPSRRPNGQRRGHHRGHSLPNAAFQQQLHYGLPPPGYSPAGNPLIPILPDGSDPSQPNAMGGAGGHGSRTAHRRARQRANSSGGDQQQHQALPPLPHGSFDAGDTHPPTPTGSSAQGAGGMHAANFSPRAEFRKLTTGFQTRSERMIPTRAMMTPPLSPIPSDAMGNGPFASRPSPRRSPTPSAAHQHQHPASMRSLPNYGAPRVPDELRVPYSPSAPMMDATPPPGSVWGVAAAGIPPSPSHDTNSSSLQAGGEAVFQAQRRNKRQQNSGRKMHMRQQSAQIYMEEFKGIEQAPACRDVVFTLLFLFHLVGMAFLANTYGVDAVFLDHPEDMTSSEEAIAISYQNVIYVAICCGAFAVVLSTLALVVMTLIAKRLVQVALFLTIALSFAWGTIGIGLSPKSVVPITGIIALAFSVCYAFVVWDRIPFAAANLHTGLSGVRQNSGVIFLSFLVQGLALLWTINFTFVLVGVYGAIQDGNLSLSSHMQVFVYSVLGISYYWTFHVLMNVVQVAVAGTIGKWWFAAGNVPQTCWNEAVSKSLFGAMFYSFGSICFGSLLVGPVRIIRMLGAFFRPSHEESSLICLHQCLNFVQQCITNLVDNLSAHFNPWAYTYIGLYGYGLLDAGSRATDCFEKRGWTKIVSDDLVPNVLLMVSFVVGGVTGCFGILIQRLDELRFTSFNQPVATAFLIGLGIGWVLTSVLFGMISSSVNSVIALFAGSPLEFHRNHPDLSVEMRGAWREVWPGCMDVVDMRAAALVPPMMPMGAPLSTSSSTVNEESPLLA